MSGRGITGNLIPIFVDNQAVLQALDNDTVWPRPVAEIRATVLGVAKRNKLNLVWIPGHANRRANKIAKQVSKQIGLRGK